jgi:hypothetical protein
MLEAHGDKGGPMKKLLVAVACAAASLATAPAALAADFTLHGGAKKADGSVRLVSDLSDKPAVNDTSWIDFDTAAGLTFAGISSLSTEYRLTENSCGGGSPRFQINVGGKNVFVYLGPSPSFTGCVQNTWLSSGNLVGTSDSCRVDTSQLAPGTQCSTWAAAVTLLGPQAVTGIQLVVDGGWFFSDKEQEVLVRNVVINGKTFVGPQQPPEQNPAKLCAAQRTLLGKAAFNELWGKNANDRNAFGKCVSSMRRAKRAGTVAQAQSAIMSAGAACKAEGLRRARLGACVSVQDGLAATPADPAGGRRRDGDDD